MLFDKYFKHIQKNGDITQHLTSVDFKEVVISGGYIVKSLEGFLCDNLEFNPFERSFIDVLDRRIKLKGESETFLQNIN